jgi:hypothetical protein
MNQNFKMSLKTEPTNFKQIYIVYLPWQANVGISEPELGTLALQQQML